MTPEERATLIWNASSQSRQDRPSFIAFVAEHIAVAEREAQLTRAVRRALSKEQKSMPCEICGQWACYWSACFLAGGLLVQYWCSAHAPDGAEYFDDDETTGEVA